MHASLLKTISLEEDQSIDKIILISLNLLEPMKKKQFPYLRDLLITKAIHQLPLILAQYYPQRRGIVSLPILHPKDLDTLVLPLLIPPIAFLNLNLIQNLNIMM